MKISRASSKKRWIAVLAAVVVVAGVGVGVYALQQNATTTTPTSSPSPSASSSPVPINTSAPAQDEVDAGAATKAQSVNPSPSPSPSTQANTLSITANNTGSTVQVRSTISATTNNGSCSLIFTKGGSSVSETSVGIQALSDYSTCKGWDVDTASLTSGIWTATVTATYDSSTATATANVTIP